MFFCTSTSLNKSLALYLCVKLEAYRTLLDELILRIDFIIKFTS